MRRIVLSVLAGALGLMGAEIATEEASALQRAENRYRSAMEMAELARGEAVGKVVAEYAVRCRADLAEAQRAGSLDLVTWLTAEIARAEREQSLPAADPPAALVGLRADLAKLRKAVASADAESARSQERAMAAFVGDLKPLEKEAVRSGRIEEAKAIREARDQAEAAKAICGDWRWLDKFDRYHGADGTMFEAGQPIGSISYTGKDANGRMTYRYEIDGGKYAGRATMRDSGNAVDIATESGFQYVGGRGAR